MQLKDKLEVIFGFKKNAILILTDIFIYFFSTLKSIQGNFMYPGIYRVLNSSPWNTRVFKAYYSKLGFGNVRHRGNWNGRLGNGWKNWNARLDTGWNCWNVRFGTGWNYRNVRLRTGWNYWNVRLRMGWNSWNVRLRPWYCNWNDWLWDTKRSCRSWREMLITVS